MACLLLLALAGCAASRSETKRPAPVAIAVSMTEGHAPTAAQLAGIHRALAREVSERGLTLVPNPEAADYVLAVRFTPDHFTTDGGHLTVIGLQPSPKRHGPSQLDQMKTEADPITQRATTF